MKCAECGNKTTWDESYGRENYIVCPKCHEKIKRENNGNVVATMKIIFEKSKIPLDKSKKV